MLTVTPSSQQENHWAVCLCLSASLDGMSSPMRRWSYTAVSAHVPEIKDVVYDPAAEEFRDTRTGHVYTRDRFALLARSRGSRDADAGTTTLERAALANTVLSKRIAQAQWRALLDGLVSCGSASADRLKGTFYDLTDEPHGAGTEAGGETDATRVLRQSIEEAPGRSIPEGSFTEVHRVSDARQTLAKTVKGLFGKNVVFVENRAPGEIRFNGREDARDAPVDGEARAAPPLAPGLRPDEPRVPLGAPPHGRPCLTPPRAARAR